MFQINEILNDIYKKMNNVQQNIIDFNKIIKIKSVKINKNLNF